MRIDDFENEIDATILGRGQAYFEEGAVVELEQVRQGLYEATVAGSDDYIVEVEIRQGEVKALECDCPYDYALCASMRWRYSTPYGKFGKNQRRGRAVKYLVSERKEGEKMRVCTL